MKQIIVLSITALVFHFAYKWLGVAGVIILLLIIFLPAASFFALHLFLEKSQKYFEEQTGLTKEKLDLMVEQVESQNKKDGA